MIFPSRSLTKGRLAVFYDSEFYIGQVLNIINPNLADVTFMASSSNRNENVFKWPEGEDLDQVAAKYVFDSDFEILPRNRAWCVKDNNRWNKLLTRWAVFQNLFGQD